MGCFTILQFYTIIVLWSMSYYWNLKLNLCPILPNTNSHLLYLLQQHFLYRCQISSSKSYQSPPQHLILSPLVILHILEHQMTKLQICELRTKNKTERNWVFVDSHMLCLLFCSLFQWSCSHLTLLCSNRKYGSSKYWYLQKVKQVFEYIVPGAPFSWQ